MNSQISKVASRVTCAVLVAVSLAYSSAEANSVSFSGTDAGSPVSGTTTNIGSLSGPSNIVFTDTLSPNTSSSSLTTTDDWSFSLPPSVFAGTVTGDQIWLKNFQISGVVDSFALYSGLVGSGTLIATGMPTGSFSSYLLDSLTSSGNYYLQVQATLAPGSPSAPTLGSYTGTLLAAPVPLPMSLPLLMSGLASLGLWSRRRHVRI